MDLRSVESINMDHLLKQDPLLKEIYSDDINNIVNSSIERRGEFNRILQNVPNTIRSRVRTILFNGVFSVNWNGDLNSEDSLKDFMLDDSILDLIHKLNPK